MACTCIPSPIESYLSVRVRFKLIFKNIIFFNAKIDRKVFFSGEIPVLAVGTYGIPNELNYFFH